MATIDYQPIANDALANVETQAQFLIDLGIGGVLQHGFQAGVAPSAKVNKVVRQSSVMTSAIASAVSQLNGNVDLADDGNVAALATLIMSAMAAAGWTTGDVKLTMKNVADPGWIMCDDGTIGSAASTATHASNANQALFTLLWTNVLDAWAPVVGGRGGSAAADWAANKKITLTKMLGRALAISGGGVGLSARALGENLGAEDAVVVTHNHTITDAGHHHNSQMDLQFLAGGSAPNILVQPGFSIPGGSVDTDTRATGIAINNAGVAAAGKNMQPSGFLNAMIKQ